MGNHGKPRPSDPKRNPRGTTREALQSAGVLGTLMAALQKRRETLRDFTRDVGRDECGA